MKKIFLAALFAAMLITGCGEQSKLYKEGVKHYERKEYPEAIQSFDRALELRKSDKPNKREMEILWNRAQAEYKLLDFKAAYDTCELLWSYQQDRKYKEISTGSLLFLEDYEGAYEKYMEAETVEGLAADNAVHFINFMMLGDRLEDKDKLKKILENSEIFLEQKDLDKAMTYSTIADIQVRAEEYDKALETYEKGLAAASDAMKKEISFDIAVLYERKGDYEGAYEHFKEYVRAYGDSPEIKHEMNFLKTRIEENKQEN